MEWLQNLLFNTDSIAHIVLLYAVVISLGIYLGKMKLFGISLGVTFVLFVGILLGHFHFTGTPATLNFVQDFGLILFVYCIGLQVGPGFFESFGQSGLKMNILAIAFVLLNIGTMFALYFIFFPGSKTELAMMVGVLCGAVTNTPGLGAANEALSQINWGEGIAAPSIANGYACAYPLGVVGIILATIAIRYICRVNLKEEQDKIAEEQANNPHATPHRMTLEVTNPALCGKNILTIRDFLGREFVCSRALHDGHVSIPTRETTFSMGDKIYITCAEDDADAITAFIGPVTEVEWEQQDVELESRRLVLTNSKLNGKTLGSMHFSSMYGVNVTRITRGGMDLFADRSIHLQVADRLMVVGPRDAVDRVEQKIGNQVKRLEHPNMAIIFIGIFLGILLGSLPLAIPGIPTPVKLGLAGGPLIVAILLGRFGYKLHLVTYTHTSANLMLREIGLVLFLASVGIKAGAGFVNTVVEGNGLIYVLAGFIITVLPILIIGTIARLRYKLNYLTIMGMIAGCTTDPPALAFANQTANNDAPALGYSTVYPLTMFLRILTAQVIILLCCG